MSKGSTRRPTQVPKDEAERRWERTFGGFLRYRLVRNKHGVAVWGGPRISGPHQNVFDHWDTMPGQKRMSGPATCRCEDCGREWPEGAGHAEYPAECNA